MQRTVTITIPFKPRPWQDTVLRALRRFSVLIVHRRGGKTVLAVMKLIDSALRHDRDNMGRFGYIAPLLKQARENTWDYLKNFTKDIPDVDVNESRMSITFANGAKIQLYGADNPDGIRGTYFDGVVLDEPAQMKPTVWGEVVRPMLADRLGWALFIGTPQGINLLSERYYQAVTDPAWYTALLTCYDTNAIDAEEIEQARAEMTDSEFAQEMLCDFHAAVENALISVQAVQDAFDREVLDIAFSFAPRVMGVDYAWMGNDRSSIAYRQGIKLHALHYWREKDPTEFAGIVAMEADKYHPEVIFIDVGYAPGVYTTVLDLGYPAVPVQFGSKATDPRFENKRAEMWFAMRDWVAVSSITHRDADLMRDLCAPTYKPNRHGKILLESKDEMRARGLPSPDGGDALACTHAFPVLPAGVGRASDYQCETGDELQRSA